MRNVNLPPAAPGSTLSAPPACIRVALETDLDRLVEMGVRFARETEYRAHVPIDEGRFRAWAQRLMAGTFGDGSVVFVVEQSGALVAMLALFLYGNPVTGERDAVEPFWWVEPEHRGHGRRLLAAGTAWAQEHGAQQLRMIAPNDAVAAMYERWGFRRVELMYAKAL